MTTDSDINIEVVTGEAFITGSRAYGTPREDSDIDLDSASMEDILALVGWVEKVTPYLQSLLDDYKQHPDIAVLSQEQEVEVRQLLSEVKDK